MNNIAILNEPIHKLEISNRTHQCLKWSSHYSRQINYIGTIGNLVALSAVQLLQLRNFGPTTLAEVEIALDKLGLKLSKQYL